MNRHARFALLTPLLVSAVAMPATMAHAAAPAAPAAAPAAACALVAAPNTNPQEFDLTLTGFKPNQNVAVTGPEKFTVTTDGQGKSTTEDVKKGNYTAKARGGQGQDHGNQNRSVGCTKPARVPATTVKITDVDISGAATTPAEVNCAVPQNVVFTGKLTGTGTGDVEATWRSGAKTSVPTVKFTAPDTATSFTAKFPGRPAPNAAMPQVAASLTVGNASDSFTFTLKCAPNT
ncbi:hypothetical protein ABT143_31720 [Streptomyces sp. NPDC002033]|uniref:hypothetical protein n=1 Tax=unclassified Streptomyces TaxID=2593676 RepID=UPI00331F2413